MAKKGDLDKLQLCVKQAHGDGKMITDCENAFVAGGGNAGVQEGGEVFSDGESTIFVSTGGKVFQQKA